jgi:hypothetical protein
MSEPQPPFLPAPKESSAGADRALIVRRCEHVRIPKGGLWIFPELWELQRL